MNQPTLTTRALALTLSFGVGAASPIAADEAKVPDASTIDAVLADYDTTHEPGCALGVYRGGKTIYAKGYGMSNLEHGLAIEPDSVFRLASVSKQFVAAAIALLDEAGQLDLDDPVQKYFPNMPDYGEPVTLRHMIHHSSGLRDYLELAWVADWDNWFTPEESFALIQRQKALNFEPGTDYLYSNSGYLLLGEVVKIVTGQSLRDWSEQNIFQPLGMKETHFHDDFTHLVPRRAAGYGRNDESVWAINMSQQNLVGDGGLYSTVGDLGRWLNNFDNNRLGKETSELIALLETPGTFNNGTPMDYAFGLSVGTLNGHREIEHGGSWVGYRTALNRYPDADLGLSVLCNRSDANPERLARRVAMLYLEDESKMEDTGQAASTIQARSEDVFELPEEQLAAYTGNYWQDEDMMLRAIVVDGGSLYYDRNWSRTRLEPVAPDQFRMADVGAEVTVRFKENALVVQVDDNEPTVMEKLADQTLTKSDLRPYSGRFYSPELDHTQTMVVGDGVLQAHRRDGPDSLKPLPGHKFMTEAGFVIEFDQDASGTVTGFRAHTGRVRNLKYERVK